MIKAVRLGTLALIPLLLGACATFGGESDNNVHFVIVPTEPVRIIQANAFTTARETVIRGRAAFPINIKNGIFTRSVQAQIDLPGGKRLAFQEIPLRQEPKPRTMGVRGFFVIHVGQFLPDGSVIHLVYDNAGHCGHRGALDRAISC